MSKHLKELHTAAAEHYVRMAKVHHAISEAHHAMSKAEGMEGHSDFHETCRDSHEVARDSNTELAEAYVKYVKADIGDLNKTTITVRQSAPDVDPEFAKLVALDERDE